ncbi:MAG: helix-turn-helix transcriptional regulator [Kiritimatiellae bacterium]|nr:helix-turn-helix transcriptional regulator [Kiritimatiellia bacterium]
MKELPERIPGLAPGVELLRELRPYLRHCGANRRPAWRIEARKLLDYLLVYIAEGRGQFIVGDERYDAEPNDLFWIPPDTVHDMTGYAPSMVCPYIHFDLVYRGEISHWDFSIPGGMTDLSDLRPLMHPDMSRTPFGKLCGRLRTYTNRRVGDLIREIISEAARAHPHAHLRTSGLIMEILAEVLRGVEGLSAEYGEHVPLLERAADHIRDHCSEPQGVKEAAAVCKLSPSYFRKLFTVHFGCAPRTYLRNARIRKAKQLMVESSLTLSEISLACGFATVHSFSRAFRAAEGIPPSAYRRYGEPAVKVGLRKIPYSR